ncbi:MAG: metallophosphoesterase [Acidimicrobiales bacterium]
MTCGSNAAVQTARLLDLLPGDFIGLGDFVYPEGTIEAFTTCYDPLFGPFFDRTLPVPGNHEYYDPGAAGYFAYFGFAKAGLPSAPWYSTTRGDWQIIVLDSNCWEIGTCAVGSPAYVWLQAQLEAAPGMCRLVAMHHPFQSSWIPYDNNQYLKPMMSLLVQHGTDIVLSGHSHHYERFAQQTENQIIDEAAGYRQFTVGTGGVAPRIPTGGATNGLLSSDPASSACSTSNCTTAGSPSDSSTRTVRRPTLVAIPASTCSHTVDEQPSPSTSRRSGGEYAHFRA